MSVRATGDLYSARLVKDALYCLPIEDVASMANSVASGSGVNLGKYITIKRNKYCICRRCSLTLIW